MSNDLRHRLGRLGEQLAADHLARFDAVNRAKRSQVRKMAGQWLIEQPERPYADVLRFDAIGVTFNLAGELVALEHLEGAF